MELFGAVQRPSRSDLLTGLRARQLGGRPEGPSGRPHFPGTRIITTMARDKRNAKRRRRPRRRPGQAHRHLWEGRRRRASSTTNPPGKRSPSCAITSRSRACSPPRRRSSPACDRADGAVLDTQRVARGAHPRPPSPVRSHRRAPASTRYCRSVTAREPPAARPGSCRQACRRRAGCRSPRSATSAAGSPSRSRVGVRHRGELRLASSAGHPPPRPIPRARAPRAKPVRIELPVARVGHDIVERRTPKSRWSLVSPAPSKLVTFDHHGLDHDLAARGVEQRAVPVDLFARLVEEHRHEPALEVLAARYSTHSPRFIVEGRSPSRSPSTQSPAIPCSSSRVQAPPAPRRARRIRRRRAPARRKPGTSCQVVNPSTGP